MVKSQDLKLALSFFVLASAAIVLTRWNGGVALLWIANAPLLAYLCRNQLSEWRSALLWSAAGSIAASTIFGPVLSAAPFFGVASVLETLLAATLLRRWRQDCDYFSSARSVIVFIFVAGVIAPMSGAFIAATTAWLAFPRPWGATFVDWAVGRGLGTLIVSPIILVLLEQGRDGWHRRLLAQLRGEGALLLGIVALATVAVFAQERLPLLFLPALPILLATFKLGRPGAALSILLIAAIGGVATAAGHGPVMMTTLSHVGQLQFFQFYLAATFVMTLPVAGALGQREQLLEALEQSEARHRRIVERSQDVIFETDASGRWTFLSEAWVRLTGVDVETSLGQRAVLAVMPDDRRKLRQAYASAEDGQISQTELRFISGCSMRWAAISVGLLHDDAGAVTGSYGTIRDVTERKSSEAAILESERRYRTLADNTTDMIATIGLDGRFRTVTPASQQLLGLTPAELVGTPCMDGVIPEDREMLLTAYRALQDGAGGQSCDYRLWRQGEPLWVEGVFHLLRDDDGAPVEVIASVRDITRRRGLQAEATAALLRVRESNRLFGMAGELASIGHWRFDVNAENVVWSDEVFRIHGIEIGNPPPLTSAMGFYHADDRERVARLIDDAVASRSGFEFTARIIRTDGVVRHVIAQGQVETDDTGEMIGMFGVFQDVTDRALAEATLRDSEARFRLITEQASDMIALLDRDGVCLFMSPASTAILGTPPEEMLGSRPIARAHEDDRATIEHYRAELWSGKSDPGASLRFRLRHADGAYAWLEASSRVSAIGDTPCVVTVWRDVTRQVAIEAELKAAKAEAEAASTAKAGFLANMSHEIRTPMNGVIGFAELLLASDLTEEQRRDAMLIADSGRAMMKLLNDILDLSKIEAGQLDVVAEAFDLPHALRACGKLLGPSAAQKRLCFDVEIADDVPRMVIGDALRVRQIVLNLLGNAIKFTEHGSVQVSARMVDEEGGAPWVAIAVQDTGIGISPERQGSIFEEFVQADHSITRRYGGTGLGLAISNRLAVLMGGRIILESRAGRGTKVTLLLPAQAAERLADVSGASVGAAPRALERPARVLLAEDHEVNQLLVRAMLAHGGHTVVLAADGAAAVDAVRRSIVNATPFDMAFMDMQMPVMDGLAATRAIRTLERAGERRLPIVALTANAFASDLEACREAGMDDHVAKPVSMEALLGAVDRWSQAGASEPAETAPTPPKRSFRPSAAAQAKYAEHRAETLAQVDELMQRGTFADDELHSVAELLHKLAGTAGMFGETLLGDRASALEEGLETWPSDERAARLADAVAGLREAA